VNNKKGSARANARALNACGSISMRTSALDDEYTVGLRLPPPFWYNDEQWRAVADVVDSRLGVDADAARCRYSDTDEVSLRDALEKTLWGQQLSIEVRDRIPLATRKQIKKDLENAGTAVRRCLLVLQEPVVCNYGPDSQVLRLDLKNWLEQIDALLDTLKSGAEWPGAFAPKDDPIDGVLRRPLSVKEELVSRVRWIYKQAFNQEPGSADNGPCADFIRVAARPLIPDLGSIRHFLEKPR
jgi:hypothetical protein